MPSPSVLDGETVDLVPLEVLAGGLGAPLVEHDKARTEQRLASLDHALGERIGPPQDVLADVLRRLQALARLLFIRVGTDLDDPAPRAAALGAPDTGTGSVADAEATATGAGADATGLLGGGSVAGTEWADAIRNPCGAGAAGGGGGGGATAAAGAAGVAGSWPAPAAAMDSAAMAAFCTVLAARTVRVLTGTAAIGSLEPGRGYACIVPVEAVVSMRAGSGGEPAPSPAGGN